ncbi:hypothetical protein SAMN05428965_1536 [Geodermatophilus sp. DSM 45219]|nr:hypothetical protein SAMN05428965_1536 [Geodermatophilus sp. DSM 45219]
MGLLARAGAAGVAAAAGLAVAGPAGGMIGSAASQMAVDLTEAMASKLGERRRQRTAVPVEHAAECLGIAVPEVTDRLTDEPELEHVTTTVLIGALSTESHEKLLFLGRVLANVLTDRAVLEEEQFLAQAIAAIEAPHVRLLDLIESQQTKSGRIVSQYALGGAELGAAFSAVLKTLESVGLIASSSIVEMRNGPMPRHPTPGEKPPQVPVATPHWVATELGKALLKRLREIAAGDIPSDQCVVL